MPSVLVHAPDDPVTLTAQAVKRLLDRGDGGAGVLGLARLGRRGAAARRSRLRSPPGDYFLSLPLG